MGYVIQKGAVTGLMRFFNLGHCPEFRRQVREAVGLCVRGKTGVHVGPLIMLAFSGPEQILRCGAQISQLAEPQSSVGHFVVGRILKESGDLFKALCTGLLGEKSVLISHLALPGEGVQQVLLCFCAHVTRFLGRVLKLCEFAGWLMADGALKVGGQRARVNITADSTHPFFHCDFLPFGVKCG